MTSSQFNAGSMEGLMHDYNTQAAYRSHTGLNGPSLSNLSGSGDLQIFPLAIMHPRLTNVTNTGFNGKRV